MGSAVGSGVAIAVGAGVGAMEGVTVGVAVGVAEGAAGRFAERAADVAVFVGGGGGYEGYVYVDVSCHYGSGSAAVASEHYGHFHAAFGDVLAYGAVD